MTIQEEFKRLQEMVSTPEGWRRIEDEWNAATNCERAEDGRGFLQKRSSSGNQVAGFAIDSETLQYDVGVPGGDHSRSYRDLANKLAATDRENFDPDRLVDGRIIPIPTFTHPLVFLMGRIGEMSMLEKLERVILEQEIGLPIRCFYERMVNMSQ